MNTTDAQVTTDNPPTGKAVVLFDGDCGLCQKSVRWLAHHDVHDRLRFASQQAEAARQWMELASEVHSGLDTIVLYSAGKVYYQSDAVLRIAGMLGFKWSWARVFLILPGFLRDPVYQWVARNRKRWFASDVCVLADGEVTRRMIADPY